MNIGCLLKKGLDYRDYSIVYTPSMNKTIAREE